MVVAEMVGAVLLPTLVIVRSDILEEIVKKVSLVFIIKYYDKVYS